MYLQFWTVHSLNCLQAVPMHILGMTRRPHVPSVTLVTNFAYAVSMTLLWTEKRQESSRLHYEYCVVLQATAQTGPSHEASELVQLMNISMC
jgi:hypothetical protein